MLCLLKKVALLETDGIKYLVIFGPEKYESIILSITDFIRLKSSISYVVSHNYEKIIKIDSDGLPLEKNIDYA